MAGGSLLKKFTANIDIKKPVAVKPFTVTEGDTGNELELTVYDGSNSIDLTGCFIAAMFAHSMGISEQDTEEGSIVIDGSKVTIDLLPSSFAPGMVECELQIYTGVDRSVLVTSASINFFCKRAILNMDTLPILPQFPLLTGLIGAVETAEAERQANEAIRISNENARIAAESIRSHNETARVNAETARAAAETARASAEHTRANSELERVAAETARATAETARATAETARAAAETARASAEHTRANNEADRVSAEALREAFETDRETAETARETAEAARASSEHTRANCELERATAEAARVAAENARTTAETARAAAEAARVSAESGRAAAELARQQTMAALLAREWTELNSFTLNAAASVIDIEHDSVSQPLSHDELRITLEGGMYGGDGIKAYVNSADGSYIEADGLIGECPLARQGFVGELYLKKPRSGNAFSEMRTMEFVNGVGKAAPMMTSAVPVSGITKYTRIRLEATDGAVFNLGVSVRVEGRNLS